MTNFGKIAYNKVNDIIRDDATSSYKFNVKTLSYVLTESNYSFSFNICANDNVIFTFNANLNCSFNVYVNGNLEYAFTNSNLKTFNLQILKASAVQVMVIGEYPINVNLTLIGNFELVNYNNLKLTALNNNLLVTKVEDGGFTIFNSDSASNTLNQFNGGVGTTFAYTFISAVGGQDSNFVLCKNNEQNLVIINLQTEVTLTKTFSSNAQIFVCDSFGASFGIAEFLQNQINLVLYSLSGEVVFESGYLQVKKLKCITKICAVTNLTDSLVYFVLQDANLNNFIVLCNFNETSQIAGFSGCVQIEKGNVVSAVKTNENNFVFAVLQTNGVKINTYSFNFNLGLKTLVQVKKHSNVVGACIVGETNYVLNFDNTLVLI